VSVISLSALRENPPHIVGPTWQRRRDGAWHLPEKTLGWEILNWMCKYLKSPEGEDTDPFMPTPEQARFILWWYAVDENGKYAYRGGVLRRMKGWGKDPLVAAMALAELCGPVHFKQFNPLTGKPVGKQRPAAWIQIAAVSSDQTQNTFLMFPAMITEKLKKEFKLDVNKTIIYGKGGTLIQGVTASPEALEGKRPTFVIMNEIQWWTESNVGHRMYNVIEGNVTKRAGQGSRFLAICNAHVPGQDSVGERMWDAYTSVQAGKAVGTKLLYDALEAPASTQVSEIPPQDVNPTGFQQGIDDLIAALEIARGDSLWLKPDAIILSILDINNPISESRRKYLNQINAAEDAWMTKAEWESAYVEDAGLQPGDMVTLGFDGSKSGDYTALVACRVSDGLIQVLKVWNPKDYDNTIPREQVDALVDFAFSRYKVVAFRADVKEFENYIDSWTTKYRKKLKVKASPGNWIAFDMRGTDSTSVKKQFAKDCERFLDAVHEGDLCHNGDKLLQQHILNAHRHPTPYDAVTIRKASKDSSRKIDAAVAAVMAFGIRQEYLMNHKRSGGVVVMQ
jgi:phage terminase large subunit-like protein